MHTIFIGSTGSSPGQTLATWALAVRLREKGMKVGFFKPYGLVPDLGPSSEGGVCDADVVLMKSFLGLTEGVEVLCPVMLTENLIPEISAGQGDDLAEKIHRAFQAISQGKDVVLIMGAKEIFFGGGLSGLSDSVLVKRFDASVLLVDGYQRDNLTFYSLLSLNSFLDGRVKSAIINHVPLDKMDHVCTKVIPFLKDKGLRSVVAVPEDPILAAFTVAAIAELIDGQILCCLEQKENLIETFTIGARHLEGPLSIFRQVYNKIIMVGLVQADEQKSTIGGIILTGGKSPSELVLKVARERSIPLVLTRGDTFQTMERLERVQPFLSLREEFKVHRFLQLVELEKDADQWVEALL